MASTVDRIHVLPNKVLEHTMLELESPVDLQSLMMADAQVSRLFQARPHVILPAVGKNCKPAQIRKLAGAVTSRHIKEFNAWEHVRLQSYLYFPLTKPQTAMHIWHGWNEPIRHTEKRIGHAPEYRPGSRPGRASRTIIHRRYSSKTRRQDTKRD